MSDPRPSPSSVIQVGDGAVQIDDTGAKHNTIKSRFREEMHAEFVQLLRAERARNDEVQALLAQEIAALQARLDTIETQRSDARAAAVAHRPAPAPAEADAPAFVPKPSPAPALAEADAPAFVPTPSPAPAIAEAAAPAFAPVPVPSMAFPAPEPTEADAPASAPPRPQSRRLERDERRSVDPVVDRAAEAPVPSPAGTTGADAPAPADAEAPVPAPVSSPAVPHAKPISYAEAFASVGGDAAVSAAAATRAHVRGLVSDPELAEAVHALLRADLNRRGFSTMLVSQPFVTNLDELYARAAAALPVFARTVARVAELAGGVPMVAPLKSKERATMKALFKYADATGVAWYRLTDLVRASIVFDDIGAMYEGLLAVVDAVGSANVREFNDRYESPMAGGYRDLQLLVTVGGHVCEVQLTTEPMQRAKSTTGHRDFEVARELVAAVAEGDLDRCRGALAFGAEHLADKARGVRALLCSADGAKILRAAAASGFAEIVYEFLRAGADVNAADPKTGQTALHAALAGGHERCVWTLISVGGADLDVLDAAGQTALVHGYAMLWKRPDETAARAVATLAGAAGAERVKAARVSAHRLVRTMMINSRVLCDHAADGDTNKLRALLMDYADPDSKSESGVPALCLAARAGHADTVSVLLDFEADVTAADAEGVGALDYAVRGTHAEIVVMLLARTTTTGGAPRTTLGADAWQALEFVPGCCRSSLTPSSLVGLPLPLKAVGYDAADCRADGLSASQCIRGGFGFDELEGVFEADVLDKIKAFDTVRLDAAPARRRATEVLALSPVGTGTQPQGPTRRSRDRRYGARARPHRARRQHQLQGSERLHAADGSSGRGPDRHGARVARLRC